MGGASSRRKGHDYERRLAALFRDVMPGAEVRRGLQSRAGHEAPDVEVPCFWVESKRCKKTNIRAAMRQAIEDCAPGKWPIAVCKDDHCTPLVTMQLEDFLDLVREWWALKQR